MTNTRYGPIWMAAVVLALLAQTGAMARDVVFKPEFFTYPCQKAMGPIEINGRLDDPAWTNAAWITRFYNISEDKPPVIMPTNQIRAAFLYDANCLYIGAVIRDRDIVCDPGLTNGNSLLSGDTFELFFQPDSTRPMYFELHVNPGNVTWESRMPAWKGRYMAWVQKSLKWNSAMKTGTTIKGTINQLDEDEGWTVEMAIPLASLMDEKGQPFLVRPGGKARFSVCTYDYSFYYDDCDNAPPLKLFSSSKLPIPQFHLRGNFNWIEFEADRH